VITIQVAIALGVAAGARALPGWRSRPAPVSPELAAAGQH
jgi:hypothetical protein